MLDKSDAFLSQLQQQAAKQAVLQQKPFLPKQLDVITSFIGRYPWQCMLVASLVSALLLELV